MNPRIVTRNRTARLVREAKTPTYTTGTGFVRIRGSHRECPECFGIGGHFAWCDKTK